MVHPTFLCILKITAFQFAVQKSQKSSNELNNMTLKRRLKMLLFFCFISKIYIYIYLEKKIKIAS